MISILLKKLNIFNYIKNPKSNPITELQDEDENNSLLLSVPLYFYIDFIKLHYKSILICFLAFTGVVIAYLWAPSTIPHKHPSLPWNDAEETNSHSIQTYSPQVYEEMLKELRKMQQTATYLQIKQQASDRKTQALQEQIQKLQMKTTENAGILNEEKAQNLIKEALLVYDADKLGLRDYALESLGGAIISTNTIVRISEVSYVLFGFFFYRTYSNPRIIIQTGVEPGKCFAFEGSVGKIRIRLSNDIFISAVTLEHASSSLLTPEEISAAPKNFAIHGIISENSGFGFPLGNFVYSVEGPPRQTFLVTNPKTVRSYGFVDFEILSNHGNEEYTCIYRLRIHGRLSI